MARIATSIEESKRLLELGIDPNTADMHWDTSEVDWVYEKEHPTLWVGKPGPIRPYFITSVPAWSLGRLVDIIYMLDDDYDLSLEYGIKMDLIANMVDIIEWIIKGCFKEPRI